VLKRLRIRAESGLWLNRSRSRHRVTPRSGQIDYPEYQSAGHGVTRAPRGKAFPGWEEYVKLRARREARRFQKREPPGLHNSRGRAKRVGGLHHQMSLEG
jgi:hypothetical protein